MKTKHITYKEACAYVDANHRHHKRPQGCILCLGLYSDGILHGVAICGRPVSRKLDDGYTMEITRVCTDGIRNGCSVLYSKCARIAHELGYKKVITYTLESENGASLKASNFKCEGKAGGTHWTGERNRRPVEEMKVRWSMEVNT